MLQIIYGWSGRPLADEADWKNWATVHVPQERHDNRYEPRNPTGNHYVGEVHENVETYSTTTIIRLNGTVQSDKTTETRICRECGATDTVGKN